MRRLMRIPVQEVTGDRVKKTFARTEFRHCAAPPRRRPMLLYAFFSRSLDKALAFFIA